MLQITRRAGEHDVPSATLTLPYDRRQKSRLRAELDGDAEPPRVVAIHLTRGSCLHDGDRLLADSGEVVLVKAADESLSVARSGDVLALARAAYHLGNRHVPVQIRTGEIAYQHDHVLDAMVAGLGLSVEWRFLPFEPEPGAYGSGHSHLSRGPSHHHSAHSHSHALESEEQTQSGSAQTEDDAGR